MAGYKKQFFERIAAFPGIKDYEFKEVGGARFRFFLNVRLEYCKMVASFGAKGRRCQTKKEAEESATMELLKDTEFLRMLDYRNWYASMDLADFHPVSALHEIIARNKLPYTARFCTSGDTTFSSTATLQPSLGTLSTLQTSGHVLSNKKWAERSAAFAMLNDARFQALVNHHQAPRAVAKQASHQPGGEGDDGVRCGECSSFLGELSHFFFYHRDGGDVLFAMKPEVLADMLQGTGRRHLPQVILPESVVAVGYDECGYESGSLRCGACNGIVGYMQHVVASLHVYAVAVGGQRFSPFRDTWASLCGQPALAQVQHRGDRDYFGEGCGGDGAGGVSSSFTGVEVKTEPADAGDAMVQDEPPPPISVEAGGQDALSADHCLPTCHAADALPGADQATTTAALVPDAEGATQQLDVDAMPMSPAGSVATVDYDSFRMGEELQDFDDIAAVLADLARED
jgi:hypothetical protein